MQVQVAQPQQQWPATPKQPPWQDAAEHICAACQRRQAVSEGNGYTSLSVVCVVVVGIRSSVSQSKLHLHCWLDRMRHHYAACEDIDSVFTLATASMQLCSTNLVNGQPL